MPLFNTRKELSSAISDHIDSEVQTMVASAQGLDDLEGLPGKIAGFIKQFLLEQIKAGSLGFALDDATMEATIRAAEAAYDKYVSPLDIPAIPNLLIEPMFDAALRMGIRPAITAAFHALKARVS